MRGKESFRVGLGAALMLALMLVGSALAAAISVDGFDDGSQSISANNSQPAASDTILVGAGTLGGERDITIAYIGGTGSVYLSADQADNNRLTYSADSGAVGSASVTWDGSDADAINNSQALNVDLTGGGTNDGFHIRLWENNSRASITLKVYSTASDWCSYSFQSPGNIATTDVVDLFLSFVGRFNPTNGTCAGAQVTWTSVSSIELFINATNPGTNLSLEFIDVNAFRDFGDAPSSYDTPVQSSHQPNGLRLGINIDAEAAKSSSAGADSDDKSLSDDEDGIARTPGYLWKPGVSGGSIDFVVNGCPVATCYLSGWVDWNQDGDFFDASESVLNSGLNGLPVNNGSYSNVGVVVPNPFSFNSSYFARFRICNQATGCNVPDRANVGTGEMEDYLWAFGPTSIKLKSLEAKPNLQGGINLLVVGLALILVFNFLLLLMNRRIDRSL